MGVAHSRVHCCSPRSGRLKIAQHFSAGLWRNKRPQSVKRTADTDIHQAKFRALQPSASRTEIVHALEIPALKCWAISSRPLRGLFTQSLYKTAWPRFFTTAVIV